MSPTVLTIITVEAKEVDAAAARMWTTCSRFRTPRKAASAAADAATALNRADAAAVSILRADFLRTFGDDPGDF